MNWASFTAFLEMGGHGPYVWGSYGVALALLIGEAMLARRRAHAAAKPGTEVRA